MDYETMKAEEDALAGKHRDCIDQFEEMISSMIGGFLMQPNHYASHLIGPVTEHLGRLLGVHLMHIDDPTSRGYITAKLKDVIGKMIDEQVAHALEVHNTVVSMHAKESTKH